MRGRPAALVWRTIVAAGVLHLSAITASAQINTQLWANVTFDWLESDRLTYSLDFEPKVLLKRPEGDPGWTSLDVTPGAEYAWRPWMDLLGEVVLGRTHQTDDVNSFELTPRIGVRFHVFSRDVRNLRPTREKVPRHRVVVRDTMRLEWRNLYYSGAQPDESSGRFRNRLELLVPMNRAKITDDGARYLLADWEWFIPVEDLSERFANKQRIRTGLGFRPNARWRVELIYAWTRSRQTIDEDFTTADNIFNVRIKRVFQ